MLQNSSNVKDWDERLKAQATRHYDNYVKRRIDLSTARADEPLRIAGEFLYVEDAYDSDTSIATIKLNRNTHDALDLEKGVEIYTLFTEVYITNDALQGEWIDIIFGINFVYKKKIAGLSNPITTAAGVDLVLLPGAGGITQIGDAGAQSRGLVNNDDLFISGKLEVDGESYFDDDASFYGWGVFWNNVRMMLGPGTNNAYIEFDQNEEEITIPVGQGAAGVVSAANLVPANSLVLAVLCRVIDAPGGGATTLDIGRTAGGNLDEFIDGIGTGLGTTGTFAADHDAATPGPIFNGAADTLTLTTDANVTVNLMKVRVLVYFIQMSPPTW